MLSHSQDKISLLSPKPEWFGFICQIFLRMKKKKIKTVFIWWRFPSTVNLKTSHKLFSADKHSETSYITAPSEHRLEPFKGLCSFPNAKLKMKQNFTCILWFISHSQTGKTAWVSPVPSHFSCILEHAETFLCFSFFTCETGIMIVLTPHRAVF